MCVVRPSVRSDELRFTATLGSSCIFAQLRPGSAISSGGIQTLFNIHQAEGLTVYGHALLLLVPF